MSDNLIIAVITAIPASITAFAALWIALHNMQKIEQIKNGKH